MCRFAFTAPFIIRVLCLILRLSPHGGGAPNTTQHVILQDLLAILGGYIGAVNIPERWLLFITIVMLLLIMYSVTILDGSLASLTPFSTPTTSCTCWWSPLSGRCTRPQSSTLSGCPARTLARCSSERRHSEQ